MKIVYLVIGENNLYGAYVQQTIIPAQIRAGRALINWSQENLADAAGIALTSVRDLEAEKRASESGTSANVRGALENAGVEFLPGSPEGGPGVRLVANRPNLIRRPSPSSMMKWDGMGVEVEFQGKTFNAFISREALEDLGSLKGTEPPEIWVKVFEAEEGNILDAIRLAFEQRDRWDNRGRLHVGGRHFRKLMA
jgi:transcriptional regulator with XRE-family HTH domain